MADADELDRLGLVAAPEVVAQPLRIAPARVSAGGNRRWPSYERCVDGAPLNSEETGPDISRADFVFCMTAITWGWSVADTADAVDGGKRQGPDERQSLRGPHRPQCGPCRGAPPAAAEAALSGRWIAAANTITGRHVYTSARSKCTQESHFCLETRPDLLLPTDQTDTAATIGAQP